MALDQEYYEKALEVLLSKGFSDKEADEIATTLSVFLPMRFINADAWANMPYDLRPTNPRAFKHMPLLDKIPELKKPVILRMPTDFTYTTYGQEYYPGPDAPTYTTGPDGYTHHPVGWASGIVGPTGVSGEAGFEEVDDLEVSDLTFNFTNRRDDAGFRMPVQSLISRFTVVVAIGGKATEMTLEEFIQKMGGYDKIPASARTAIDHVMEHYHNTPVELGGTLEGAMPSMSLRELPAGVSQKEAEYLKLNDLSDIEGIKRAYPNIDEETAQSLSDMQRKIDQRLGRHRNEPADIELFNLPRVLPEAVQQAQRQYRGSLFEKFLAEEPIEEPHDAIVKIMTHSIRNLGHGFQITTPLFGQSYKNPTGPQTMPGLEKGPNGKPHRRKKGKGKRYERGY